MKTPPQPTNYVTPPTASITEAKIIPIDTNASGEPHPDTQRLDWLERKAINIYATVSRYYVTRAADGHEFSGYTLRAAIDAAAAGREAT